MHRPMPLFAPVTTAYFSFSNFMFINWPPKGTPLELIAQVTGDSLYLLGYAAFAAIVIGLIYAGIELYHRRRHGAGK